MSIELQKESIIINETLAELMEEQTAQIDVIVPDVQPDILRVLQIDGISSISEHSIEGGRLMLKGATEFKILYLPERGDEEGAMVRGITINQPFTHAFNIPKSGDDVMVRVSADVEHIEFELINSRKVNIKAVITLDANLSAPMPLELVTDILGEQEFQIQSKPVSSYNMISKEEMGFVISDKLEIPSGKPGMDSVLKVDAHITGKDMKVINNKVVAKGSINICTLYNSDNGELQCAEHEMPFTEILDVEGVSEDMSCELDYKINSVYYQTQEDEDGDTRLMGIEVEIMAGVTAYGMVSVDILSDCYLPGHNVQIETNPCSIASIAVDSANQITLKDTAVLSDDVPGIAQIYNVVTRPYIEETLIEDGRITIRGSVDTYFLYMTEDHNNPIYTYKKDVPFSHNIESPNIKQYMTCDCKPCVQNVTYSLINSSEIDARYTVSLDAKVKSTTQTNVITSIALGEEVAAEVKRPSIIIYFVQKNDTLWDIAKRYNTSIEAICEVNCLESEIDRGMRLLIPKHTA